MEGILDTAVIAASLALVIAAVLGAAGKKQTGTEYFLAGRDLRWPFIGMPLLASNISAEHVVGMAGDGYRVGMVTGGYQWVAAWCLIILASLFAPVFGQQDLHYPGIPRAPLRMGTARVSLRQPAGDECPDQDRAVRLHGDPMVGVPMRISRPASTARSV